MTAVYITPLYSAVRAVYARTCVLPMLRFLVKAAAYGVARSRIVFVRRAVMVLRHCFVIREAAALADVIF
ncbi:hypothetical protein ACFV2E_09820 [Streptomyces globisporus]|uniref:hypothetical protein n=1 Tax=Streptomyces globisporus TaxID=1908 RepID=UPI0036917DDF